MSTTSETVADALHMAAPAVSTLVGMSPAGILGATITQSAIGLAELLIRTLGHDAAAALLVDQRRAIAALVDTIEPERRTAALARLYALRPDLAPGVHQPARPYRGPEDLRLAMDAAAVPTTIMPPPDTIPGDEPVFDPYEDEDL